MTLQLGGNGAITGCTSLQEPDLIVSGLTVNGDIDAPKVIVASGTNALPSYTFSGDIDTGLYAPAANTVGISTGGNEHLRIDSVGNVGIGISNPDFNCHIAGTGTDLLKIQRSGAGGGARFRMINGDANYYDIFHDGAEALGIQFNGSERMRIDSAGNVGIGTSSPSRLLELKSSAPIIRLTESTNTYSEISANSSVLSFKADESNGAGSTRIDFRLDGSEAMRIDSAGNVGIGTTSPNVLLNVEGTSGSSSVAEFSYTGGNSVYLKLANASNALGFIGYETQDITFYNNNTEHLRIDSSGNLNLTGSTDQRIRLNTAGAGGNDSVNIRGDGNSIKLNAATGTGNHIFEIGGTERMRIDSSGNVGIGTSSPNFSLDVNGVVGIAEGASLVWHDNSGNVAAQVYGDALDNLVFRNTSSLTERMRIDSSGSLLVGRTSAYNSPPGEVAVFQGARHGVVIFQAANANYTGLNIRNSYANNGGNNVSGNMITFHDNGGTERGKITTNGSSTSYVTSSDYRLKENVVDITDGITRIKQLLPKRFNFIVDVNTTVDGFLAHEAQAVVPEAITGTKDEVDDDGNAVMQGIDQSKLVPLLTAALQEAITKIETLEQRLTDLQH